MIDVASQSCNPTNFQYLVGTHHIDDEDGLVNETTRVVFRKGSIAAYRRLVTSSDTKPREEATPIHIADVACITAALRFSNHPAHDSVSGATTTPCGTPGVCQSGNFTCDLYRGRGV